MGMFDSITDIGPIPCHECGNPLHSWQSKDGECTMSQVPYWRVTRFYTACSKCGMWHEYVERNAILPPFRPLSDYQLLIRARGEPWDSLRAADEATAVHYGGVDN